MRTYKSLVVLLLITTLALFLSCESNPVGDDTNIEKKSEGSISLKVGDENGCINRRPDYSWEGDGVKALTVTDSAGSEIVWSLTADDGKNSIPSPVTQGKAPDKTSLTDNTNDKDQKLPKEKTLLLKVEREDGKYGMIWFTNTGGCN